MESPRGPLSVSLLAATVVAVLASACLAGPTVTVGGNVPAARRIAVGQIDHAAWNVLLKKYVDASGMVNYVGWKASAADQQALDGYLHALSAASFAGAPRREAKLAFWINAYNAVTVKGILREYPTTSIRNHTPRLYGYHIWKDLVLPVEGRTYSLDQIEHEVLRKLGEPRIHFAIVCASLGCPRLLNEAFTAVRLDEQLSINARAFFANRAKFTYDPVRRTIQVSQILDWFGEDFGTSQADRLRAIAPYFPDEAARKLAASGDASVSYLDYDWNLNDQARAARR